MKKIKQLFRKGVALALAAVTTLSVLPAATVSAASQRATITFAYCYDGNGNTIRYQQTASHNGVTFSHAGEARTRIYADGDNAYCIEPGISLHTGNTLEKDASVVWNNLGKAKQDAVNLALLYGAQGSMGSLSGTEDEKVLATQMVIWEIVSGCRNATAPYAQTDAKFYNSLCVGGANSGIAAAYQQIISGMVSHGTIPSFASGSTDSAPQELKWDGKQYVLKLTDSNGVLSKFNFTSSNSDVKVSKSGNILTITSSKAIAGNVQLSATKKIPTVSSSAKLIAYGDPSLQDIVTGVENTAAVKAYLNVKIPYGHIQIVKTSEDGVVAGLKFQITGNGIDQTVTTGEDGTIKVENLQPGTYTVTELTENRYEPQKAQTVEVKGGETAAVDFSNILKRGDLKVTKTSEDGLVEGMKFHLYGTSLSGIPVDEYAVTDSTGVATISRYRSGDRVPEADSRQLENLAKGIAAIAAEKKIREMEEEAVRQALSEQAQGPGIEIEKLRLNFDTLLKTLSVSVSDLARFLSYDPSYLSRIRKGQRKLSDPQKFTADAFLKLDAKTEGTRRSILSSLPLYTADDELVFQVLRDNRVSEKNQIRIMEHIAFQRELTEEILSHDSIFEAYPNFSKDEFAQYPMTLSLAGAFYEEDIVYTYEQYREHLEMMKRFSQMHKNYHIEENKSPAFRHIQILIHEGSWAIVSKEKTPAIHFVIRHPKMREAMENITMPIVEGKEYK